jgi:hypothetical protein
MVRWRARPEADTLRNVKGALPDGARLFLDAYFGAAVAVAGVVGSGIADE